MKSSIEILPSTGRGFLACGRCRRRQLPSAGATGVGAAGGFAWAAFTFFVSSTRVLL